MAEREVHTNAQSSDRTTIDKEDRCRKNERRRGAQRLLPCLTGERDTQHPDTGQNASNWRQWHLTDSILQLIHSAHVAGRFFSGPLGLIQPASVLYRQSLSGCIWRSGFDGGWQSYPPRVMVHQTQLDETSCDKSN